MRVSLLLFTPVMFPDVSAAIRLTVAYVLLYLRVPAAATVPDVAGVPEYVGSWWLLNCC